MSDTQATMQQTALLLVDLQNDFLAPDGAYAKAGQSAPSIGALPAIVLDLATTVKSHGGLIVASRFTLWPDASGEPMISPHLKSLRPFLSGSDFAPGSNGQQVVEPLLPLVDVAVDKVAYSAFFNTQLDWVIKKAGITRLIVTGIVTQGGVASTVRDAHVRDFEPVVISDCCASFKRSVHETALADMASIATVCTSAEFMQTVG